jgi:hypothetical protein
MVWNRRIAIGIILGTCLAAGTGCQHTKMPTSDSTRPLVRWHVENLSNGNDVMILGSASYHSGPNESLRITMIAEDPEGIHKIRLEAEALLQCRANSNEPIAQNKYVTYAPDEQTLGPDSSNNVLSSIFLVKSFNSVESIYPCQPDFHLTSGTISLKGTGENYFGGTAQAQLDIIIFP